MREGSSPSWGETVILDEEVGEEAHLLATPAWSRASVTLIKGSAVADCNEDATGSHCSY